MSKPEAPEAAYRVVVNARGQHSLWPAARPLPAGWQAAGVAGSRERCLAHIEETWTSLVPVEAGPP